MLVHLFKKSDKSNSLKSSPPFSRKPIVHVLRLINILFGLDCSFTYLNPFFYLNLLQISNIN